MVKIDAKTAIERFSEYLDEIKRLKKLNHSQEKDKVGELIEKIRSLINVSFDDDAQKLDHFKPNPYFSVSTGMSKEELEVNSQDYHERRLDMMKNYITGYSEELKLILETNKQSNKLSELESEIKEKELEAKRRKTVVETKVYGAEIEIITFLRDELKRYSENARAISELNSKITRIDDMLTQFMNQQKSNKQQMRENPEDKWYDEIVKKQQNLSYGGGYITNAKTTYSHITLLRSQINDINKILSKPQDLVNDVYYNSQLKSKTEELNKELQDLAKQWSLYS